jgi:hypothetical protein
MKIFGTIIIILAAGLLSWALFSTSHPFISFPINSNASGTIPQTGTRAVNLYFPNSKLGPVSACPKIFPVERHVADTPLIFRDTLGALLLGPTDAEKNDGYGTALTSSNIIQSLRVEDGLASIDFEQPLTKELPSSCAVKTAHAQVEATTRQFSFINTVMLSARGTAQP